MPFDSNGVFSLVPGYLAVTGQTILASQHNPPLQDIAAALSQVVLRSGVAPMTGNLPMGGYKITGAAAGSADGDYVTMEQLNGLSSSIAIAAPVGTLAAFRRKTAPVGWVLEDGRTIGSASSGATARAHADTINLYTMLWNDFANSELLIQTSGGVPTTRGASAAADFAANKRLPLFDSRTRFLRGADLALNYDPTIIIGASQADEFRSHHHLATVSGSTLHSHTVRGVAPGAGVDTGVISGTFTGDTGAVNPASVPLPTVDIGGNGGFETRPRSTVVMFCIKL